MTSRTCVCLRSSASRFFCSSRSRLRFSSSSRSRRTARSFHSSSFSKRTSICALSAVSRPYPPPAPFLSIRSFSVIGSISSSLSIAFSTDFIDRSFFILVIYRPFPSFHCKAIISLFVSRKRSIIVGTKTGHGLVYNSIDEARRIMGKLYCRVQFIDLTRLYLLICY